MALPDLGPIAPPRQALPAPGRVDVLGVHISAIDLHTALETMAGWIDRRERHYVCVAGVHGVMESQHDEALREIHNRAGLTTPDGMPLVWCAHRAGARHVTRVYGPDLLLDACARGAAEGWRMFFLGGAEGVADELSATLSVRFPGLQVVGTSCPPRRPLTAEEDDELVSTVNAAAPDIVWVGLGTPKQERFMADHVGRLSAPVLVGVGAAFDFHTGRVRQAPAWIQRRGLEWAFRLAMEPRRLWRRYLKNNPRFVLAIVRRPPRLLPPTPHA